MKKSLVAFAVLFLASTAMTTAHAEGISRKNLLTTIKVVEKTCELPKLMDPVVAKMKEARELACGPDGVEGVCKVSTESLATFRRIKTGMVSLCETKVVLEASLAKLDE